MDSLTKKLYGMNLIIFGPPGSGKGTYASRLEPILGIRKLNTGDVFREIVKENTELAKKVESYVSKGNLVPDDMTIEVVREMISRPDYKNGVIFDGYPRTTPQAEALGTMVKIDVIINLVVPEWIIVERFSTRVICRQCGTIYNVKYLKPKVEGICDKCGGELYQRKDDKPEVIRERFEVYQKQTAPLLDYYKGKITFADIECNDVNVPPEIMVNKILDELEKIGLKK
ncbi:MAG: nucleoside monophosphate kinase [Candidatus Helarchaeota archaeon]|nr:nucleoside monophosphate kinase [Candidatus Helarchaeota archaeon]